MKPKTSRFVTWQEVADLEKQQTKYQLEVDALMAELRELQYQIANHDLMVAIDPNACPLHHNQQLRDQPSVMPQSRDQSVCDSVTGALAPNQQITAAATDDTVDNCL